ncbi:MAG: 3-ketoacyl-ACP reductase [Kiritimatiellaeota bacterium]|nr:3-ketoacyl-ACP reductase [Kiritimatiellota bacterium]
MKNVAMVTGGSRGIGHGCAVELARQGFDLVIAGRRPEAECREALEGLRALGAKVVYAVCDVAEAGERKALMEVARKEFGRLNVLVNNAGVAPKERNDILCATEASYDFVMDTNLKGPYFLTQAVANWMVEQRNGGRTSSCADNGFYCIINVSSISATVISVNRGEYCLSKAGVSMATQLWAARLSEHGINVYEVRPGVIATDMTAGVTAKYDKVIADGGIPIRRWGYPEDVGKAVASLASGAFAYTTGQVVMVDGGMTLQRL